MAADDLVPLPACGERLGEGRLRNGGGLEIFRAARRGAARRGAPSPGLSPRGGERGRFSGDAFRGQGDLFAPESANPEPAKPAEPEGFRYQSELITAQEEAALLAELAALPFEPFDFHGYKANREVVSYGWSYSYERRRIAEVEPIPAFLHGLRARAAAFAGRPAEAFVQVLINAYRPGAGVGWHRDRPHFGEVVGVSLGSATPFRFRRREGEGWVRRTLIVEPRSAYLMSGPARWAWEHSVPPAERPRWSITLRTLA